MRRFARSMKHALRGLWHAATTEKNFQIEIFSALLVLMLTILLPLTPQGETLLVLTVLGVLVIELINTAMERVVDMLKPRVHPYARIAKDVMAAAVLLTSIGAVFVGFIIFWPHILQLIGR